MHPTERIVRQFHESWDLRDPDRGAAVIAEDCDFEDIARGEKLPGKVSLQLKAGDRLTIKTPGGGGYSPAKSDQSIT